MLISCIVKFKVPVPVSDPVPDVERIVPVLSESERGGVDPLLYFLEMNVSPLFIYFSPPQSMSACPRWPCNT